MRQVVSCTNQVIKRIVLSEYLVLALSMVYFVSVLPFTPDLISTRNLYNIFSNALPLLVVAVGQTLVLITAGIDLSVTSTIGLASIAGAIVMNQSDGLLAASPFAVPAAIMGMLAVGMLVGWLNGASIAYLHMPPFMVTLTTMMFFHGFSVWVTQSQKIFNLPEGFVLLAYGGFGGIPYALLLAGFIVLAGHTILTQTVTGRWLYAVGSSIPTAQVSGVRIHRAIIFAYVFSGFCAAVSSMLYTARLETGDPEMGRRILLDVIGAVVIGGTSLFGGRGKVLWTVYGVLFITILDNSLNMLRLSHFVIMMVKGSVILLAALIDAIRNKWLAVTR